MPYEWRRSRQNSSSTSSDRASPSPPTRSSPETMLSPLVLSKSSTSLESTPCRVLQPSVLAKSSPNLFSRSQAAALFKPVQPGCCPTCSRRFDPENELLRPRIVPCLHTFCTECLQRVQDHLTASGGARQRYSWRRRSTGGAKSSVLGHFLCPFCHGMTPIPMGIEGIRSFPVNQLVGQTSANELKQVGKSGSHSSLLEMVVREIHPKIKVIQRAICDTECCKEHLLESVDAVERKCTGLLFWQAKPVCTMREDLFAKLRLLKLKHMNRIVRRLLLLKQCEQDLRFLCGIVQQLMGKEQEDTLMASLVLPCVAKRLADLGNVLDSSSMAGEEEDDCSADGLEAELTGTRPQRAFAELTTPLYEKVLCEIPLVIVDELGCPIDKLQERSISGGLLLKQNQFVSGKMKHSSNLGMVFMEVVPSCSGIAEIDVKIGDDESALEVRPSTAFIRPLILDPAYNPLKRSSSCHNSSSYRSLKTVSI